MEPGINPTATRNGNRAIKKSAAPIRERENPAVWKNDLHAEPAGYPNEEGGVIEENLSK